MHKRNVAAIWLPWTPTRPELEEAQELKVQNQWVQEEEKLKNALALQEIQQAERPEERLNRLLLGYDLKKTVL